MTKKKVAPKKAVKKVAPKKVIRRAAVEMLTYSIKMVIPTGQYANIQPEIVVKSGSIEEAHDFIAPHMNKLWKEYYLVNERRPEPVTPPTTPPVTVPGAGNPVGDPTVSPSENQSTTTAPPVSVQESTTAPGVNYLTDPQAPVAGKPMTTKEIAVSMGGKVLEVTPGVQAPDSTVALIKATQAIESCLSLDALEIIRAQIDKSVKLIQADKETLQPLLLARLEYLTNK